MQVKSVTLIFIKFIFPQKYITKNEDYLPLIWKVKQIHIPRNTPTYQFQLETVKLQTNNRQEM